MQIFVNFNANFWNITTKFRDVPKKKISIQRRKIGLLKDFVDPPPQLKNPS